MKRVLLIILALCSLSSSKSLTDVLKNSENHILSQSRYVMADQEASKELRQLARSQGDIISQIIATRAGDRDLFSDQTTDNACRDWWFVIAPACFFLEGLGQDPSSSYPCCRLDE